MGDLLSFPRRPAELRTFQADPAEIAHLVQVGLNRFGRAADEAERRQAAAFLVVQAVHLAAAEVGLSDASGAVAGALTVWRNPHGDEARR